MPDDFARAAGAPNSIRIDGKEYLVSKFTPRDIGDLQAWLKTEIPNPLIEAKRLIEGLPDAVAIEIWRTMAEESKFWPPTLEHERSNTLLTTTTEGIARLLWVTLRKNNRVDLAAARELADNIELNTITELVRLASPESGGPKA